MPRPVDASPASEAEDLLALIGTVYDAAIDRNRWIDAIEQACKFLGCVAGVLGGLDFLQGNPSIALQWGYASDYWQSYVDHYFQMNPLNAPAFRARIGEISVGSEQAAWKDLLTTEFYKEWVQAQGIIDLVQGVLDKSASGIALLTCARHKSAGPLDRLEIRRLGLIIPHFRRAFLIGKLLDLHQTRSIAFAEAIDGLAAGVFLVSATGGYVHANVRGRAMLDVGDPLRLAQGALVANDEKALRVLRTAFATAAQGDVEIEARGVSVPILARDGSHFTAHVLPLTSGARQRVGANLSAVAALFVRKASIDLPSAIGAATQLYGFTPAEERVLSAVIEIGGLAKVAVVLGVARRTVQTHLEHLFEKTGSRRQADLVKLIAGYDAPIRARNRQ